ncbi:Uma2 family endonuclease [Nocardia terpenica]|uniref:Putative restriction endonuclease domain-containing protein n=1 Tax=Nocardia terpenica TaxID=455432 RepID=A0A6G9Z9V2_9NOCA|nr:Uma2 family endonuclease [Nocardia terpenica]QIS21793.1 hypothetical protein F6W96_29130 [Nocardia terpenica]
MSEATLSYHWSRDEFVRAWKAGVFDHRVELVEGEIWPVVIGDWHGGTVGEIIGMLRHPGVRVMTSTLAAGDSLPDPDCWVKRIDAEPAGSVGARLSIWKPEDVLLVVEVSDETVMQDLTIKQKMYGRTGYPVYWVVTQDVIYEHTEPTQDGYRRRTEYRPGDRIPIPYANADIAVGELLELE